MRDISEQQLVDCDDNCHGCMGGHMVYAWMYIQENAGHSTCEESEYPYVARDNACVKNSCEGGISEIPFIYQVSKNNADALMGAIEIASISTACAAAGNFMKYKSGIITKKLGCGS